MLLVDKLFCTKDPYDLPGTERLFAAALAQNAAAQRAGCAEYDRILRRTGYDQAALLARAGVVRITRAGGMSRTLAGEAHDGRYALREYTRVVEWED